MSTTIIEWTKKVRQQFPHKPGRVIDIGSLNVNGTVKDLFSDSEIYVGIDMREGKDVDVVINAHSLLDQFDFNSFDTVICMDMLEHDNAFWITLANINSLLRSKGYLWIVQPTIGFPIHNHPDDYWRATEQAFKEVYYHGYKLLNMETVYTKEDDNGKKINPVLCALGQKL